MRTWTAFALCLFSLWGGHSWLQPPFQGGFSSAPEPGAATSQARVSKAVHSSSYGLRPVPAFLAFSSTNGEEPPGKAARSQEWLAPQLKAVAYMGLNQRQQGNAPIVRREPRSPNGLQLLGVSVPMRDGIHLSADVFLPKTTGRWPSILIRTPYGRKSLNNDGFKVLIGSGYALVVVDVRGRPTSEGVFRTIDQEGPDGNDTLNWIAAQPWSNGKVAMAGASYVGMTQWWAAIQDNPHLQAISPMFSGDDEYSDRFYSPGGALKLGHRLLWIAQNFTPSSHVRPLFSSYIDHLPLRTADITATGEVLPVWRTALDHPSYDPFWKSKSIREKWRNVNVPVLSFGGWFDNYAESDLDLFSKLASAHKPVETWIGPWGHVPGLPFPTRDFGAEAMIPFRRLQAEFFDRYLKSALSFSPAKTPLLHIFLMGPDVWKEEHEWPLARTRYTALYLDSDGHANTREGDGELLRRPVKKAKPDIFTYDPANPVPTIGGAICCSASILPPGPLEQTPVEKRTDVLVYTSAPLTEEVEVTGPVRALLYVSTSANDTDFTVKLVDVGIDGRALAVCDGIQRLRYRLSLEHPVFVKRNAPYQISVDAGVTSYMFAKGHRIRVEVSSSNFPRFDRNLNSFAANADVVKVTVAKQTVYHEKDYPSAVILPVIPKGAA